MVRALVIEDDPMSLEVLGEIISGAGFDVCPVHSLEKARRELEQCRFHLLVTDLVLPDGNALELLECFEQWPQKPEIVFVTGQASVDTAVKALRGGAVDYLTKPVDLGRLREVLANALRKAELQLEVEHLRQELRDLGRFGRMVGKSPQMQVVYDQIQRVGPTEASVFITGATGTGKELAAETVHARSARARGPFVPVNCGAISPSLIESELFGHERGSFTGAARRHQGLFERAAGGSLFLDEITEMPFELQVKLLRALESRTIQRVGGTDLIPTDVRVIAASNRDPQECVAQGRLREDLLYRLLVVSIRLPSLAEREGDVELLAHHFLAEINQENDTSKTFTPDAEAVLRAHSWPGNVRELRNAVESAYIMAGDHIDARALSLLRSPAARPQPESTPAPTPVVVETAPIAPPPVEPTPSDSESLGIQVGMSIAEAEQMLLHATLQKLGGNKRRTAEQLGISLKTLYNWLNRDGTTREETP